MHGLRIAFLLIVFFSGLYAAQQTQKPDPQHLQHTLAKAVELHQSGDLQKALGAYKEFLQFEPRHAQALSNLGAVYARLGRYQEAIEQYLQALNIEPESATFHFNLGLAYYKSAQLADAGSEFARVLELEADNKNALILLADGYFQQGENKKVVELLSPVEANYPDDMAVAYLLGTALIRDNQVEKGQVRIDRIFRKGDSAEARLMLGTAHLMGMDYKGALQEFERAIQLNPDLPAMHAFYGRALMATGNPAKAEKAFRQELSVNPNDYQANLYLGVLLKQEQRFGEALPFLQHALNVRPGSDEGMYQLGSLYVSLGKLSEAQRVLEDLLKKTPDFLEAHVSLATVYYRLKRKEDGDRHRAIVEKLTAERQAKTPGASEKLGPAYRGEDSSKVPRP